jgi:methionyl-tRNA formyltransferase
VFFGSSKFAVESLRALLESRHEVICAITQPDREKGRGLHLGKTPVKIFAEEKGLKIYQPFRKDLKKEIDLLRSLDADMFVVVAYGLILPKEIINLPKLFCINLHASLLPAYRGAAPINWAIINNEKQTGVSIIKLSESMDAGPIISSKKIVIDKDDNAFTLEEKLAHAGSKLLVDTINSIESGNYKLKEQDKAKVTFAPKLTRQSGSIDWNDKAENIYNLIRGCFGWPGAFTYYKGKLIKIIRSDWDKSRDPDYEPGQICSIQKEGIRVNAADATVVIKELQPEGKKIMSCAEFISGHKLAKGDTFAISP